MKTQSKFAPTVDVGKLRIVDEPYSDGRAVIRSKYDDFFGNLKPNQRIVCPSGKAGGLGNSLRNWLIRRGHKNPVIRTRERCQDGDGGVWWISEPKTVWAGLGKAKK